MSFGFITHPTCWLHEMGKGHPECPERLSAINDYLIENRLMELMIPYEAPSINKTHLERVHQQEYLNFITGKVPISGYYSIDGETTINPNTVEAAYHAAGAVIKGVDLVLAGEVESVFCAVRPPGHHAEHDRAMGFCFFNNVAVGAAYSLTLPKISKVAIVDFDVHHGNGTEDIMRNREDILLLSSFQDPLYPGSPWEKNNPHIINVPLEPGTNSSIFRDRLNNTWWPELEKFVPDLIFVSAGFDAHKADPLASINLVEDDFQWLGDQIYTYAKYFCQGRVITTLEGGYNLIALASSVAAYLRPYLGL